MDARIQQLIVRRQQANQEILRNIEEGNDILRLKEIMQYQRDPASFDIIGIKEPFNEESVVTLNRMRKND